MEKHFETLKNFVFAKKYAIKNGGYTFQLYKVSNELVKIGGTDQNGFILDFFETGQRSNSCETLIDLYNSIRGTNENLKAFKQINN